MHSSQPEPESLKLLTQSTNENQPIIQLETFFTWTIIKKFVPLPMGSIKLHSIGSFTHHSQDGIIVLLVIIKGLYCLPIHQRFRQAIHWKQKWLLVEGLQQNQNLSKKVMRIWKKILQLITEFSNWKAMLCRKNANDALGQDETTSTDYIQI